MKAYSLAKDDHGQPCPYWHGKREGSVGEWQRHGSKNWKGDRYLLQIHRSQGAGEFMLHEDNCDLRTVEDFLFEEIPTLRRP